MAMKGYFILSQLQNCNLKIIPRTLISGILPLYRVAVDVFNSYNKRIGCLGFMAYQPLQPTALFIIYFHIFEFI